MPGTVIDYINCTAFCFSNKCVYICTREQNWHTCLYKFPYIVSHSKTRSEWMKCSLVYFCVMFYFSSPVGLPNLIQFNSYWLKCHTRLHWVGLTTFILCLIPDSDIRLLHFLDLYNQQLLYFRLVCFIDCVSKS